VLKDTIAKFLKLDTLIGNLTGYVEVRLELLKLEVKEDLARGLAKAAVFMAIGVVSLLFIFLISMAIAYKIGEEIGIFGGFAIVAVFYVFVALLLWLFRNAIGEKIEKQLKGIMKLKKK
jgi:cytosine/uracil/thiamine/allantoin permease